MNLMSFAEQPWVPDPILRAGIRYLCHKRQAQEHDNSVEHASERYADCIKMLEQSPIAVETQKANEQHYELPAEFFKQVLGPRLKYSSCYFPQPDTSLEAAEDAALAASAERAELEDGQHILELGCGWGSLTLWMATAYPNSKITAVSNSNSQREYIETKALKLGLKNLSVITQDINIINLPAASFDRVVSIEMFEHVRNYYQLFNRIRTWLKPRGKLWCHIFCHRYLVYPFEVQSEYDWMSKYFFSGGMMPAYDTFLHFQEHLNLEQRWAWSGTHYAATANAWLANMDRKQAQLQPLFEACYEQDATLWWQRWRLFFMACAELFGIDHGNAWHVGHYRFVKLP